MQLTAAAGLVSANAIAAPAPILVAAASDLARVMPEIGKAFAAQSGEAITVSYGSTGNFARQIRQGAPFEVFLAADDAVVAQLHSDGVIAAPGLAYAEGRLALVANLRSPFAGELTLGAIAEAVRNQQPFRLAIANPEHAPYGQRAMDILDRWSIAELLRPRLVYGENVAQALQFVGTGAAAVGLVALSLAEAPTMKGAIAAEPMRSDWHRPLIQTLALTARAGAGAQKLRAFMHSEKARALLRAAGFGIPGEQG